eukprot:gene37179-45865_t
MHPHHDTPSDAATSAQHPFAARTPDVVLDALASVGLYGDGRLMALSSYENRVYQVSLEDGARVVAKFYRPERWSQAQILEEHAFAAELTAAEVAEAGLNVRPPMVLAVIESENTKSICRPETGLPVTSITWKISVAASWRPNPPVPLSAILVVLALTNLMEPVAAGSTVRLAVLVTVAPPSVALAVMMSVTPQPRSE